jgi:RNA polymerase sigma-70 factor (ECF subfamily)
MGQNEQLTGKQLINEAMTMQYSLTLIASQMVGETDAEDAVQETYLRVLSFAGSYDPSRGEPKVWIRAILRNHVRDLRRERHRLRLSRLLDEDALQMSRRGEIGSTLEDQERNDRIRLVLRSLNPLDRDVLLLDYFTTANYKTMAQILGIPEGTVKSRAPSARAKLYRYFQSVEDI